MEKKEKARGAYQIACENEDSINLYLKFWTIPFILNFLVSYYWAWGLAKSHIFLFLTSGLSAGCWMAMKQFGRPTYMEGAPTKSKKSLLSSGMDLNLNGSIFYHLKDVIILTGIVDLLAIFSNYFWMIWFLIPSTALYKLWVSVIQPWIFMPAPEPAGERNGGNKGTKLRKYCANHK
ncbi:hypothetical protein SNEBB_004914 [Seison nebaliae]|nr:hypothetical protein SNEBB_004914 [Seison nebaliae]